MARHGEAPIIFRLAGEASPLIAGDRGAGLVGVLNGDLIASLIGDLNVSLFGVPNILLLAGESAFIIGFTGELFCFIGDRVKSRPGGELNKLRISLRWAPRTVLWVLLGEP